jgi:hypothetical protein
MGMKIFTLFALVLYLGISTGFGKVYLGLKVKGDYKKLHIAFEDVEENPLKISTEDVVRTIKLSLLRNGIKPIDLMIEGSAAQKADHYLYFSMATIPIGRSIAYSWTLELAKFTRSYMKTGSETASIYVPRQGDYSPFGVEHQKADFLDSLRSRVDKFCLNYLESNMAD